MIKEFNIFCFFGMALGMVSVMAQDNAKLSVKELRFRKAVKPLTKTYNEVKPKLPKAVKHSFSSNYEYLSTHIKSCWIGIAEHRLAGIAENNSKLLRCWAIPTPSNGWDGYYNDGGGGRLRLVKQGDRLKFDINVHRTSRFKFGRFVGSAKIHGSFALFSKKFSDEEEETTFLFIRERNGKRIRLRTSNVDRFHDEWAYFRGTYVRSEALEDYRDSSKLPTPSRKKLRKLLEKWLIIKQGASDKEMMKVSEIGLWKCFYTSEDLSHLSLLTNLREICLETTYITNITPLKRLNKLTKIRLFDSHITDLSPLSKLTRLTELNISKNSVSDLSPLKGLKNLERLSVGKNLVKDFTPLRKLTKLKYIDFRGSELADVSGFDSIPNLKYVTVYDTAPNRATYNQILEFRKQMKDPKPKWKVEFIRKFDR